jgi:hypothetical protein
MEQATPLQTTNTSFKEKTAHFFKRVSNCGRFKIQAPNCSSVNTFCNLSVALFALYTRPNIAFIALGTGAVIGLAHTVSPVKVFEKTEGGIGPICASGWLERLAGVKLNQNQRLIADSIYLAIHVDMCPKYFAPIASGCQGFFLAQSLVSLFLGSKEVTSSSTNHCTNCSGEEGAKPVYPQLSPKIPATPANSINVQN